MLRPCSLALVVLVSGCVVYDDPYDYTTTTTTTIFVPVNSAPYVLRAVLGGERTRRRSAVARTEAMNGKRIRERSATFVPWRVNP